MKITRPLTAILLALPVALSFSTVPARADDAYEAPRITEAWVDATPQPRGARLFQAAMLVDHNRARAAVSERPLVWDDGLASDAGRYATQLAETRTFAHSKRAAGQPVQGENLWMGTTRAYSYGDMSKSWVEEDRDFQSGHFPNISRTGSWHDVGHYTQIVWANTKAVGCAIAVNASDEYLVCRYFPAGNVWGQNPLNP